MITREAAKGKGLAKEKSKGKGKGRGGGNRNNKETTLVVKKKVKSQDNEGASSSMMVSNDGDDDRGADGEGSEVEEKLYNLMRGYTSLMITDLGKDESHSESEHEASARQEECDPVVLENNAREETKEKETLPVDSEWEPITTAPEWGSSSSSVVMEPTWGNVREQNIQSSNTEEANFWIQRARISERAQRNEAIERGGSPPPNSKKTICFPKGTPDPEKGRSTSRRRRPTIGDGETRLQMKKRKR